MFSVSFSLRSWAGPRRFWSPTWPQLGSILELCWALFGTFLGVVLASSLKIAFRHDFDGSLIDFRPSEATKTLKNSWFFKGFCFFARSLLRPLLDRFWIDFGTKNRSKIGPKRPSKAIENHVRFLVLSRPSKNQFFGQHAPNMARFWPPRWPQVGSQMGSKSIQNRPWKRNRLRNRFWDDFGRILGRFWADFGPILGPCLVDFWFILVAFGLLLVTVLHRVAIQTRA